MISKIRRFATTVSSHLFIIIEILLILLHSIIQAIGNILTQLLEVLESEYMYSLLLSVKYVGTEIFRLSRQLQYMSVPSWLLKAACAGEGDTCLTTPNLEHMHTWTHSHTSIFCLCTTGFFVCQLLSIPRWGGVVVSWGTCESFYHSLINHTHKMSELIQDCLISCSSEFIVA